MLLSELRDAIDRHVLRYGDGPVVAETRDEVLDVVKAAADKFEPVDDEPWSLVLILDYEAS